MRLTHKILILALLPLTFGGALILFAGFYFNVRALLDEAELRTHLQVQVHAQEMQSFFESHIRTMDVLAASKVFRQGNLSEILPQLKQWEGRLPDVESLYYNELDGTVHSADGNTFSVADRYYFPAIQRGETVISKPIVSRATGVPVVLILVPVFDEQGKRIAALGGTIRISKLIEKVKDIRVGSTGFAILIDDEDNLISGSLEDAKGQKMKNAILHSVNGYMEGNGNVSLGGEACHVHWGRISPGKWRLALVSKEAEELSKVKRSTQVTVLMLAGTGLLAIFLALVLCKFLLTPIRRLMEVQRRMASGDLSARADESSADEFGDLSRSFNKMLDSIAEANNRLNDSEVMLRGVFNVAPAVIGILGPDRVIREINEGTFPLLGYTREELIGKNIAILYAVNDEYESRVAFLYSDLDKNGKASAEGRLRRKDASFVDVLLGLSMLRPDDPGAGTVVVIVDITARKLAEKALREREEEFRTVFEFAPWSMVVTDAEHRYVDVNSKFCEFSGLPREQIVGRRFDELPELFRMEESEKQDALMRKTREQGYLEEEEMTLVRPSDGKRVFVIISSRSINIAGRHNNISMIMDISERKKLEEQLRQSQKMEAIGYLAGGVAHDFNNMLQAILGYSGLALDKLRQDSPAFMPLTEVQKAGERAAALTRQLLAFSRQQLLDMAPLDLNSVLEELVKMIKRLIHENIELCIELGKIRVVNADRSQLEQVIVNLCVNARDAMPDGGQLLIETENVSFDAKYCASNEWAKEGDYVCLSVTDSGRGIEPKVLEHIFDPFFTTKGLGEGTGLGLSTVYGIIRQHEGMIRVYSEVDKGTRFNIYLPVSNEPCGETMRNTEATESPALGGHQTILFAEDEEQIRELNQIVLEDAGYRVLTAADGEEALRLYHEHKGKVDLLFLDVVMPKKGGRVVLDEIRALNPEVKCLFTSGYSVNAIHTNFILHSGISLLQKPYTGSELLRAIQRALAGSNEK
ncbi:MAG: hypothetical protein A2X49_14885 [Lentisphaerae bacterium GWF2_52_8]|nr:MAG: hypothetical protein A2X49_14885 [Lentisphaerae bacterium GWF2_52_8]